jgi:hypothetical protein
MYECWLYVQDIKRKRKVKIKKREPLNKRSDSLLNNLIPITYNPYLLFFAFSFSFFLKAPLSKNVCLSKSKSSSNFLELESKF